MRAADMVVVILDSSTSAEEGGPYVADVTYYGPDGPGSESTGVILCEDTKRSGETIRCYDNTGLMARVEACDVAEMLTLAEVRDRLLD